MTVPPRPSIGALVLLGLTLCASALELRSYDATLHDRFVGFPAEPKFNPNFAYASERMAGVGWDADHAYKQFALISRCHVLFAAHHAPALGTTIRFLSTSGSIMERTVAATAKVSNPSGSTSDVLLITLSSPIEAADGIDPLPYLDLPSEEDYSNRDLIVLGSLAKAGDGKLAGFQTINVNWIVSRTFRFDYSIQEGDNGDAKLASGDSGSPTLIDIDGTPALLGIHLASSINGDRQSNYDAFIPYYIEQINGMIESAGFRMRPLNASGSDLNCTSSITSGSARHGDPLELEFEIANTSDVDTGNLELSIRFPEGSEPDAVSANGWVITGAGTQWSGRRASLDSSSMTKINVSWNTAPIQTAIEPTLVWRSDSSEETSSAFSIPLSPSFTTWAATIESEESGQTDDPDHDGRTNFLEYAFGGDPLSGADFLMNGQSIHPTISISAGAITCRFPEREDKVERGLVYTPEWTNNLGVGSWSGTPPEGFVSNTTPYDPEVPGFVERSLTWPITRSHHFIRVDVSESE